MSFGYNPGVHFTPMSVATPVNASLDTLYVPTTKNPVTTAFANHVALVNEKHRNTISNDSLKSASVMSGISAVLAFAGASVLIALGALGLVHPAIAVPFVIAMFALGVFASFNGKNLYSASMSQDEVRQKANTMNVMELAAHHEKDIEQIENQTARARSLPQHSFFRDLMNNHGNSSAIPTIY